MLNCWCHGLDDEILLISECGSTVQDQGDVDVSWMTTRKTMLPDDGTVEHYAQKARELLLELRYAEKRWAGRELEYQQRELQMSKHVAMVRHVAFNFAGNLGPNHVCHCHGGGGD